MAIPDFRERTVCVVDDNVDLCNVLRRLVESNGMRCETYSSAESFLRGFNPARTGCILLDVRMPGMSGLELQEFLHRNSSTTPVLVLTGHADVPVALRAMKAGAFEFLEKPVSNQLLLEHIRRALVEDERNRQARERIRKIRENASTLTPREREVMAMVVKGKANKRIGAELGLSQKTVEVHRSHVMQKMNAKSLAELVRMAIAMENDSEEEGTRFVA